MKLNELVTQRKWQEVQVEVGDEAIDFVVFPWDEVKARDEDGASNVWEYFIGFDGPVFDKVESGQWTPFGAGNMSASALKHDGGFQESGHRGMLFADAAGGLVFYDHNEGDEPTKLGVKVDDLK